ncbi:hypothetical protein [Nocardioides sp. 503]|uniref:hypothetical protein n=1 Tax=Nocardioides sp. 503 TaxID=2508326 RepID=UPI001FD6802B|nr:hypothetical protein [Nocardioides sp. 503]
MSEPREPTGSVEPDEPTLESGEPDVPTAESGEAGESDWKRRRRLEAVFGDALPDTTSDERDPAGREDNDAWLRAQVPPHHGG